MSRLQKLIVLLIMFVPVLLMTVWSVTYVTNQFRRVVLNASWLLTDQLTRQLGREVTIGKARVTPLGTAVLEDVRIASGKTLAGGDLLRAKEIRVSYDFKALLYRGQGAGSVKSVTVTDPYVLLIRRKDGKLNIYDLFKRKAGPTGPPFKAKVTLVGGTVLFKDYLAPGNPPVVVRVRDVRATLDAGSVPVYAFHGTALGTNGQLKSASATGSFDSKTKVLTMDVTADGLSAPFAVRYFPFSKRVHVTGGRMRVVAGITYGKPAGPASVSVVGVVKLADGAFSAPGVPGSVEGVNGTVVLAGQRIAMALSARFAGSAIRTVGTISDFRKPIVDIAVSSTALDFGRLARLAGRNLRQVRLQGKGPMSARVAGNLADPTVAFTASIPRVGVGDYLAQDVAVSATCGHKMFDIHSVRLRFEGATVVAGGTISMAGVPTVSIRGSASGLNLGGLPLPAEYKASGVVNAGFTVSGPLAAPSISTDVAVAKGSIRGIPFSSVSLRAGFNQAAGAFTGVLSLNVAGGAVKIQGSASPRNLNLGYSAEGLSLARLGPMIGQKEIEGMVYAEGRITGSPKSPLVSGAMELFKGRWEGYQADFARVVFAGNRHSVRIVEGVVRRFPAEAKFSGKLFNLDTDRIAFQGEAHAQRLQMVRLLELLGRQLDVTGTVTGDFTVSGAYLRKPPRGTFPLVGISASGSLRLDDGRAFGYLINTASAHLAFDKDVLTLSDTKITSESAEIDLGGSVNVLTKQVDAHFDVANFDLARARDKVENYVLVSGIANARGYVVGPWDRISASAEVSVEKLSINNAAFDRAILEVAYSGDTLNSLDLKLTRGSQGLEIAAKDYNLSTNCVASVTGNINNISVPDIWKLLLASPYLRSESAGSISETIARVPRLTSGVMNGTFHLDGCMSNPNGSVQMVARNVGVDITQIESVRLDASVENGAVMLKELAAKSEDTYFEARPLAPGVPVYKDGKVQFDIEAHNLDLARLRPWLGANTPLGVLTAEFTVNGSARAPDIRGSVEVANPSMHGFALDRLRVSRIQFVKDRIELSDIIFAMGNHQLVAQGYVPWDWSALSVPADKPMEITAQLEGEDLSILSTFTPMIDVGRTKGALEARLTVSGTVVDPKLSGLVRVSNGTVGLKGFTNLFQNVDVDVAINGKQLLVNKLFAASSLGGTFEVQPGGSITMRDLSHYDVNLPFDARGLVVDERNAFGYHETVRAQIDVGLLAEGLAVLGGAPVPKGETPLRIIGKSIAGSVDGIRISHANIGFALPEKTSKSSAMSFPIDPQFDIGIDFGEGVRIAPPNMSITLRPYDSGGRLSGSLSSVVFLLDPLEVAEGEMWLGSARLRLQPGGQVRVRYLAPQAPELYLNNFQATTSLTATDQLGQTRRYQITITVNGPIDHMQISLSSDPPGLSRAQMLAALGHVQGLFAAGENELQKELTTVLTAVGTSTLFAPIERLFTERFGFEQFTLEYNTVAPLSLYLSRQLFGDFYVSFYQRLTPGTGSPLVSNTAWQFWFTYRLKMLYTFGVGVDDQQTITAQIGLTRQF